MLATGGASSLLVLLQAAQRVACPSKLLFAQTGLIDLDDPLLQNVVDLAVLGVMPPSVWGKDSDLFEALLSVITAKSASIECAEFAVKRIDEPFYSSLPKYSSSKSPERAKLFMALCEATRAGVPSAAAQMALLPLEVVSCFPQYLFQLFASLPVAASSLRVELCRKCVELTAFCNVQLCVCVCWSPHV